MKEIKQEIISIKRSVDSLDGQIISYLKSNPLKLDVDFSDIVIDTLKVHWLPFVVSSIGIRDEELRRIGIWAINQLEAQASLIRGVFGIPSQVVGAVVPSPITAQDVNSMNSPNLSTGVEPSEKGEEVTEEYDYERGLIPMELTDDMKITNSLCGIHS